MKISAKFISLSFFSYHVVGAFLASYFYAIPQVKRVETRQGLKYVPRVKYRIVQENDLLAIKATDWGE